MGKVLCPGHAECPLWEWAPRIIFSSYTPPTSLRPKRCWPSAREEKTTSSPTVECGIELKNTRTGSRVNGYLNTHNAFESCSVLFKSTNLDWVSLILPKYCEFLAKGYYNHSSVLDQNVKQRRPSYTVTFSMGHTGASRKSPNDPPWEMLRQRLCGPISVKP